MLSTLRLLLKVLFITLYNYNKLFILFSIQAIFLVTREARRLDNLEEALENVEMQFIVPRDTFLESLLKSSNNGVYHDTWRRVKQYPHSLLDANDILTFGYDRVQTESNVAVFTERSAAKKYMAEHHEADLYVTRSSIYNSLSYLIYRKSFPYAELFNSEIVKLKESGL